MFWTVAVLLVIVWALGMLTSTTLGGLVHVLLAVLVVMIVVKILTTALNQSTSK